MMTCQPCFSQLSTEARCAACRHCDPPDRHPGSDPPLEVSEMPNEFKSVVKMMSNQPTISSILKLQADMASQAQTMDFG